MFATKRVMLPSCGTLLWQVSQHLLHTATRNASTCTLKDVPHVHCVYGTSGKSLLGLHHHEVAPKRGVDQQVSIERAEQPAAESKHHT